MRIDLRRIVHSDMFGTAVKLLEALSYLAGIVTLVVIAWQLTEDARERRVSQSLDLVKQFGDEPISNYRAEIRDFEFSLGDELDEIERNGGISPADAAVLIRGRIATFEAAHPDRKVAQSIRDIASFFDEVHICQERGLCDSDVIDDFLKSEALDFQCTYGGIVRDQSRIFNKRNLGEGMRALTKGTTCLPQSSG